MCKILALTNSKKLDLKKINKIGNMLLKIERDGFGYAIQGETGVFGEKCIAEKFESRLYRYGIDLPIISKTHEMFGVLSRPIGPAIFHGRTSTNDAGLINCHPMILKNHYLIHNGVVTDHGPKYKKITTNDSEDVLHRFLQGIDSVEKHLSGYYAFTAIDNIGQLHVVKDSVARLSMSWCESLSTYIIGTDHEIIEKTAKILQVKIGPIEKIDDDTYGIFQDNTLIKNIKIKPRGYSRVESAYASKSLGFGLSDFKYDYQDYRSDNIGNVLDYTEDDKEDDYYSYLDEINNLDDNYTITDVSGERISLTQFYKLDHISQELCTIIRPDGTVIEVDSPDYRKAE